MERWQRIEAIFEGALHRPLAERDAFLRDACADDSDLCREVASLLAHHADIPTEPWAAAAAARMMGVRTALQVGERLGPYEIISFVAAGGMGEVYKALDTRLDRFVAVKRLTAPHSDRFQSEARAIAALNHPHICQVYDVGPDYLVMEYLDGETLADRLGRSKERRLHANEALAIAIQVADAVNAAHARGILHRDLKPGNIMLQGTRSSSTSDKSEDPAPAAVTQSARDSLKHTAAVRSNTGDISVKLVDFGLAKLQTWDADVTRTAEGTVLGTAAYMSPEQAEGHVLDVRSDIFSFGVVLYELLSGQRPFEGATTAQVLSAVLRDDPHPLRTTLPPLDRIVHRCLAKDPGQRFQTMAEVKMTLEQIAAEPASTDRAEPKPSIAVLPFADMSAGKDQEWFSDGLAEEIINALAQISGLKVIARTSAFAFKGKNEDIRRIANTLGVAHVLEGSVRRAGDRIRVTAQLIAAADGSHLWSQRYDRDITDVFAIQDDIARTIVSALEVKLSIDPAARRRHTPSIAAYEAYLRGAYHLSKTTPESLTRAREYLEQAIALDPEFALPHVALGAYSTLLTMYGLQPARETTSLARARLLRALELEPALPEAHAVLGSLVSSYDYDWNEADGRFRQAIARSPVSLVVRLYYGMYLVRTGRPHQGVEQLRLAILEDPLNAGFYHALAVAFDASERIEEAATEYRRALELDDRFFIAYEGLATSQASRGMLTEALEAAEGAHRLAPWNATGIGILGGLLRRMGDVTRAEALRQQLGNGEQFGSPIGLALFHAMCGESEPGAEWLEKAIEQRDPRALVYLSVPTGKVWRTSSRWPALARTMNLPA